MIRLSYIFKDQINQKKLVIRKDRIISIAEENGLTHLIVDVGAQTADVYVTNSVDEITQLMGV